MTLEEAIKILKEAPLTEYDDVNEAIDTLIAHASQPQEGEKYPCKDCGKLRTKAEGGTTFTLCDECWDKHYKKEPLPSPAQAEEKPIGVIPLKTWSILTQMEETLPPQSAKGLDFDEIWADFEQFLEPHSCNLRIKEHFAINAFHIKDWFKRLCKK